MYLQGGPKMVTTSVREKIGFVTLEKVGDYAGQEFVKDVLWTLPLYGVTKLWLWQNRRNPNPVLCTALGKLHGSIQQRLRRAHALGDRMKVHVFLELSNAMSPGFGGNFDQFRMYVLRCHAEWTNDGCFTWGASVELAHSNLEELEAEYGRFVKACARVIAQHLTGR